MPPRNRTGQPLLTSLKTVHLPGTAPWSVVSYKKSEEAGGTAVDEVTTSTLLQPWNNYYNSLKNDRDTTPGQQPTHYAQHVIHYGTRKVTFMQERANLFPLVVSVASNGDRCQPWPRNDSSCFVMWGTSYHPVVAQWCRSRSCPWDSRTCCVLSTRLVWLWLCSWVSVSTRSL